MRSKKERVASERGKGGKQDFLEGGNTSRNKNPKCFLTCI